MIKSSRRPCGGVRLIACLLCLIFTCASSVHAQTGFWRTYEYLDSRPTKFINIINVNDTLVIYASAEVDGHHGMLFIKMDTFGNVLLEEFHLDGFRTPWRASEGYNIIENSEHGYSVIGSDKYGGILMQLDEGGLLVSTQSFVDSTVMGEEYSKCIELEDSKFVAGIKQRQDFYTDVFVKGIYSDGQELFERRYGDPGVYCLISKMLAIDANNILIGAWKTEDLREGVFWQQPWIFCIDSLGDVKWEWLGERDIKAGIVNDLVVTDDGGIVFLNTFVDSIGDIGQEIGYTRVRLIKLDSNRNEVWRSTVGQATFYLNDLSDLVLTAENDFIATGKYVPLFDWDSLSVLVNWTVKFSSVGEVKWERFDSTFFHPVLGTFDDPSGLTLLSSGSIVICGNAVHIDDVAYIIKLDKNGCMEEGCELDPITRVNVPFDQNLEVLIYPNPATESTTVEFPGSGNVVLFDIQGRVRLTISNVKDQARLDLSDIAPGTYFVRVVTDLGWTRP